MPGVANGAGQGPMAALLQTSPPLRPTRHSGQQPVAHFGTHFAETRWPRHGAGGFYGLTGPPRAAQFRCAGAPVRQESQAGTSLRPLSLRPVPSGTSPSAPAAWHSVGGRGWGGARGRLLWAGLSRAAGRGDASVWSQFIAP